MINEPAATPDYYPFVRVSNPNQTAESALNKQLREAVETVFIVERETFLGDGDPKDLAGSLPMILPNSRVVARFEGQLLTDSERAYQSLDDLLAPTDHLPVFREDDGKHVILVIEGRVNPAPRPWWPNALLFVLTLLSVLFVGALQALSAINAADPGRGEELLAQLPLQLWRGLPYAISILLILGAHELGHYFAARHHKLNVTLPYFIPMPFGLFGTLGAAIQLREPLRNRKVLMDVGAAGPLAGLFFAIPILIIGLATSQVREITGGGMVEGNSVVYFLTKLVVKGQVLPNSEVDVYVNQMAWAGWTGLFVTALNLIPVGQLDGGHVLYSIIGERARRLYLPMIAVLIGLSIISPVWVLWVILLFLFGHLYATPLDMITPLDNRRRYIAYAVLAVFVLVFVPRPLREIVVQESGDGGNLPGGQAVWAIPYAVGMLTLWTNRAGVLHRWSQLQAWIVRLRSRR